MTPAEWGELDRNSTVAYSTAMCGRVEAAFEGSDEAVDEAIAWCRTGTPSAIVQDVEVLEETPTGEVGFRVAR